MQMNPQTGSKDISAGSASASENMSASSSSPFRRVENNENHHAALTNALSNGDENEEMMVAGGNTAKLERSKIIWILHNIKKSVHGIIYYGDLSQKGQLELRKQNQLLIKSVYEF